MAFLPQRPRVVVGCVLILGLATLVGCGGGKKKAVSLSGKVTYKGEPVPGGTLTLTPADGKQAANVPIDANGVYAITPPAIGEMKVTIETESLRRKPQYNRPDIDASKQTKYKEIPRKYSNLMSTDLKVTIAQGENKQDFDLKD